MGHYKDFIPENIAFPGVRRIGIYNSQGNRVGQIPLGKLSFPVSGKKLYSFGALSDIHLQYSTALADFQNAMSFLKENEDIDFLCISGDLTASGTDEELQAYKTAVENAAPDFPVYAISGNHDTQRSEGLTEAMERYTGHPLFYTFPHGDDVFIMFGVQGNAKGALFSTDALQWLYETLEENRNRRCFLFQHVNPHNSSGNAMGIYGYDIWGGTEAAVVESLLKHYPNVVFFHGHSHLKFYLQYGDSKANYDNSWGCHSVHIPSLAVPRDGDASGASSRQEVYADSEGYVVDVYEQGIHLRGRDFVKGEYLPIASYWLDTTVKMVVADTYTDSTGTICTTI